MKELELPKMARRKLEEVMMGTKSDVEKNGIKIGFKACFDVFMPEVILLLEEIESKNLALAHSWADQVFSSEDLNKS